MVNPILDRKSETPNNKIILLTLTPTYPKDEPIQSYWRVNELQKFWRFLTY